MSQEEKGQDDKESYKELKDKSKLFLIFLNFRIEFYESFQTKCQALSLSKTKDF